MSTEVETSSGRLRGMETSGIRSFRGVRFAASPHGRRRFLPPEPPEPWTGTRDAFESGPSAPQLAVPLLSWINASGHTPGEDCLSLNVWTPGLDGAKRPVLVWIHGGGFMVGSGATPLYDGADLARRGDLVVVTINYRLGAMGFSNVGTVLGGELASSTNLGLRDQIAALEWVAENIAAFGGDPGQVTIFGQSAGAMSIAALLGAPRARKLFHRAVLMSGAADHVLDREVAEEAAQHFISALGGAPPSPEEFGRLPIDRVLSAQHDTMLAYSDLRRLMAFLPAVDGDVLTEQPLDAVRRGDAAGIELMIGSTLDEWKLFRFMDERLPVLSEAALEERFAEAMGESSDAPRPKQAVARFRRALGTRSAASTASGVWNAFQSSRVFHAPASRLAEAHFAAGGRSRAYLFTWRTPFMRSMFGSCHALDIPFVFGSTQHPLARPFTGISNAAGRLSRIMQHAWIDFARGGDPGHDRLPEWPHYDSARRHTMIFGRHCHLDKAPLEKERRLIESWDVVGTGNPAEQLRAG